MTFVIRPARPTDQEAITRIHIEVGAQTYRGLQSDNYLDVIRPKEKSKLWKERFSDPNSAEKFTLVVAQDGEDVVGFLLFQLDEEQEHGTYLHHLYIAASHQGMRLGAQLIVNAIATLSSVRHAMPVHLVALSGNTRAIRFYEKLGGQLIDQYEREQNDGPSITLARYQWPSAFDLSLAAQKSLN